MTDRKPRLSFGAGALRAIPAILTKRKVRKVLLVSGASAYSGSGAQKIFPALMRDYEVIRFSQFTSNPNIDEVATAIRLVRETHCDAVLAVGGGTALDIAKAAALLAAQEDSAREHILSTSALQPRRCLLVLVPSTAGSGSEMTSFAAIYVNGKKTSFDHRLLLADYAIVDPDLTIGLPARIAASAGMDAICQAIESLWSIRSTGRSRRLAAESLKLALSHIEEFCTRRTLISRTAMARAALLAGMAINITRTTAPHAVSYSLTSRFHVPHGHSCALTLPAFLIYNASVAERDVRDPRGVRWVKRRIREILQLLAVDSPEAGRLKLIQVIQATKLESRLSDLGLGLEAIDWIVTNGYDLDRAANNPRQLTRAGLRDVLAFSL
jgi:alcohol dehydrogenase class IV